MFFIAKHSANVSVIFYMTALIMGLYLGTMVAELRQIFFEAVGGRLYDGFF